MKDPDLTILALANAKLLPPEVQDPFDRWRIWRTRDVVAAAVRKRLPKPSQGSFPTLQFYLERLESADNEQTIFEGIYALAEVVDVQRVQMGMHSEYIILIMAGQLNPWGLLEFQADFEQPAASVVAAAQELWRLAREHNVDIPALLTKITNDDTLKSLQDYYANGAKPLTDVPIDPQTKSS